MAAIALVLVAIGAGLYVLGTPSGARAQRLDERRVDDLHRCAIVTSTHWRSIGQLPAASLCEAVDPQTGQRYEYVRQSGSVYQLCAVFEASSPPGGPPRWQHGAGRTCFTIDAAHTPPGPPEGPIRR